MMVIRKTPMAMKKLLIGRPCPRAAAVASASTADGAACRRVALHQSASTRPFEHPAPAMPAHESQPPILRAIITQLRATLDREFAAPGAGCPLWERSAARLPPNEWCYRCG